MLTTALSPLQVGLLFQTIKEQYDQYGPSRSLHNLPSQGSVLSMYDQMIRAFRDNLMRVAQVVSNLAQQICL